MNNFSLLLCTYKNDNPLHLKECLDSIVAGTVYPSEIVIVKDGPLTDELEAVLRNFNFPNKMNIVALPRNMTLGVARAEGTKAASHNCIALMDSDDIIVPDRFEKQLAAIEKNPDINIIGGQIAEFNEVKSQAHASRQVPVNHEDILVYVKKRNPFNAMTDMFKKDLALESGNFRYFPGFEDYDLWARMIRNGAVCRNCPEVLVYARTGSGMYSRRRGVGYIRQEWRMQRLLRNLRITTAAQFLTNALKRIPLRLLPGFLIKRIYTKYFRGKA